MAQISIMRGASILLTVNIDQRSTLNRSLNGDDVVNLTFSLDSFTEILIGDYIVFRGRTYTINQAPTFIKHSNVHYQYSLRLEGPQYTAASALFLNIDGKGDFYLTGVAEDFISLAVDNINRVLGLGIWDIGSVVMTDFKTLHFNNENCLNVIRRVCEEFDLEYEIDNNEITLSESIGKTTGLSFEYHNGLRNIERTKVGGKDLVTRLYAFGSEKNIDYNYRSNAGRLKFSDAGYMDKNTETYGVIEAAKTFEDVYPHFTGVVDSTPQPNQVVDASIDFNLNDYLIEGETAKIVFLSGNLSGREFEISAYDHVTKKVTLKQYTDNDGLTLPDALPGRAPSAGDKFTFVDIRMPQTYIDAAETELYNKAVAHLDTLSSPNVIYQLKLDWHHLQQGAVSLDVGDVVEITDAELAPGGVNFRVLELTQNISNPYQYKIKVGESILISYLQKMTGQIGQIGNKVVVQDDDSYRRIKRAYQLHDQLQDSIFDPDGYFDTDKIKPLSIETGMLTVGMKGQQLTLAGMEFDVSPGGNLQRVDWTGGSLTHYTINELGFKTWTLTGGAHLSLATGTVYYIYARCSKTLSTGDIYITSLQMQTDPGTSYYYFLLGVLHTVIDGERSLSLTYGLTTITGRLIKTGKISSLDGSTYFDLDSNQIVMSSGEAGGFTVDTERLLFSDGNMDLSLSNDELTTGTTNGRGLNLYAYNTIIADGEAKVVSVGQIRTKDSLNYPASPEYGFEIIKRDGVGYKHLVRIGKASALFAGWNLDSDAIYTGSKKTTNGFSDDGTTFAADGSIHAENIALNGDGTFSFRTKKTGERMEMTGGELLLYDSAKMVMKAYIEAGKPAWIMNDGTGWGWYRADRIAYGTGAVDQVLRWSDDGLFVPKAMNFDLKSIIQTSYNILKTDSMLVYNYTAGNSTWNLPSAPNDGHLLILINNTTQSVTINGNGKMINDSGSQYTSRPMASRTTWIISYNGSTWSTLSYR